MPFFSAKSGISQMIVHDETNDASDYSSTQSIASSSASAKIALPTSARMSSPEIPFDWKLLFTITAVVVLVGLAGYFRWKSYKKKKLLGRDLT